jgi:hypothetical protein
MKNGTVSKKIINFSNFLSSQVVINQLRPSRFQQNRLKEMAVIDCQGLCDNWTQFYFTQRVD